MSRDSHPASRGIIRLGRSLALPKSRKAVYSFGLAATPRYIDDGQARSDCIATISGSRASAGGRPLARLERRAVSIVDVVDHPLALGGLARPDMMHQHSQAVDSLVRPGRIK